jgi:hypothetical protein
MPFYDFECKNNHITETVVSYDKRKEPQVCDECGEPAYYQLSFCTNFQYGSNYSSFAADSHKWNLRENHRKNHMKKNQSYTG